MSPPDVLTELQAQINEKAEIEQVKGIEEKEKQPRKRSTHKKKMSGLFNKLKEGFKHGPKSIKTSSMQSSVGSIVSKKGPQLAKKKIDPKLDEYNYVLTHPDNSVKLSGLWKIMKAKLAENEHFKKVCISLL